MQLYIANPTQQYHEFTYRVPESTKLIVQRINPGGQIRISANRGNLSTVDIDSIFEQHGKYGLIRESEVGKALNRGQLCPLVASVDKPVNLDRVIAQIRFNREVLVERGKASREAAAVALNEQIEQNIAMSGAPDVLREVEFSVEETKRAQTLDRSGRADEEGMARELADTAPIGEGIKVSRDAEREPLRPVRAGRSRRGRRS